MGDKMKIRERITKENLKEIFEICKRDKSKIMFYEEWGVNLIKESLLYDEQDLVNWFLDNNASVNIVDDEGKTPLSYACQFGNPTIIKKTAVLTNDKIKKKSRAMHHAILSENKDHLLTLIDLGFSLDEKTKDGHCLMVAALKTIQEEELSKGVLSEVKEKRTNQLLIVDCLLKNGAEINDKVKEEIKRLSTLDTLVDTGILTYCYENKLTDLLQFMILNGINAHVQNLQFDSAFEYFIEKGEEKWVKLILEHSNPDDINDISSLIKARKNLDMVRLLLQMGVNPNAQIYGDKQALQHIASHIDFYYSKEFVEVLIEYGADINAKTERNWTPLVDILIIKEGYEDKQKEFFDLIMKHKPILDDTDVSKGFSNSKPEYVLDVLDVSISQGRYHWFKPYLNQMSLEEQVFYEGKKLLNLIKADEGIIELKKIVV